jgi:hypothetical protein
LTKTQKHDYGTSWNSLRCHQLSQLQYYEEKHYSQYGEDGVLLTILAILGMKYKYFVEFGVESGYECNTRILREKLGYDGLMMDGGYENSSINLRKEWITTENIIDLFVKHEVPKLFDVLSVDLDMFDWFILQKIFESGNYKPRIVIVETNPTLCYEHHDIYYNINEYSAVNSVPLTVLHPRMTNQTTWDGTRYAGANPKAFQLLAEMYGYEVVYCERCGVNCFMVQRSEIEKLCGSSGEHLKYSPSFQTPFQCFGSIKTGGKYSGHEVDYSGRMVLEVNRYLVEVIKTQDFDVNNLSPITRVCSPSSPHWGHDWCDRIFDLQQFCFVAIHNRLDLSGVAADVNEVDTAANVMTDISVSVCDLINHAISAFYRHDFENSIASFRKLSDSSDIQSNCRTMHRSDIACRVFACVHFNIAVISLHLMKLALYSYDDLVQQILVELEASTSYGSHDRHMEAVRDFVVCLTGLKRFQDSPKSKWLMETSALDDSWDVNETLSVLFIENLLNGHLSLNFTLSFDAEAEGKTDARLITIYISIGPCDDVDDVLLRSFDGYQLDSYSYDIIRKEVMKNMNLKFYQYIPFNLWWDVGDAVMTGIQKLFANKPSVPPCLEKLVTQTHIRNIISEICFT